MKIQEIVDIIRYERPLLDEDSSADVIKYGDADKECTGIVVTCSPTVEVLRETVKRGANLIIVHEPLFWSHKDTTDWLEDSAVFREKRAILDEGGIVVWRYHDHMHVGVTASQDVSRRDHIFYGLMKELGWEEYLVKSEDKPLEYKIPETDATELGIWLKEKMNLNGIRIIGDPHTKVSRIYFCEHLKENRPDGDKILKTEFENIDAVIPLEMIDWTVAAFINDSCQLGKSKVLYHIGHFNVEEFGMKHLVQTLPQLIGHDVPISYVQSGDAYKYIV